MQLRRSRVRFDDESLVSSAIELESDRLMAVVVPDDVNCGDIAIETRHADIVNTVEVPWNLVLADQIPGDAGWCPVYEDLALMSTHFVRSAAGPGFELGLVLAPRS